MCVLRCTISSHNKSHACLPGVHLNPQQFHDTLLSARSAPSEDTVLMDVRNLYETCIGHFDVVSCSLVASDLSFLLCVFKASLCLSVHIVLHQTWLSNSCVLICVTNRMVYHCSILARDNSAISLLSPIDSSANSPTSACLCTAQVSGGWASEEMCWVLHEFKLLISYFLFET